MEESQLRLPNNINVFKELSNSDIFHLIKLLPGYINSTDDEIKSVIDEFIYNNRKEHVKKIMQNDFKEDPEGESPIYSRKQSLYLLFFNSLPRKVSDLNNITYMDLYNIVKYIPRFSGSEKKLIRRIQKSLFYIHSDYDTDDESNDPRGGRPFNYRHIAIDKAEEDELMHALTKVYEKYRRCQYYRV